MQAPRYTPRSPTGAARADNGRGACKMGNVDLEMDSGPLSPGTCHEPTLVARTLSSNHMLENTGQTVEFAAFTENFTCLLPCAEVTGARDCPKGGLSLVSAAPRLISAPLFRRICFSLSRR